MIYYKSKTLVIIAFLLSTSITVIAQDKAELAIVEADSTWGKEIIKFPIKDWAPKLTLEGFEELRFAPNWNDKDHEEFWSLVMSWNVKTKTEIPLYELQFNLNHYFDDLMKPNHWSDEFPDPKLTFDEPVTIENRTTFKGQLTVFDGFHTGKVITLYILGEQMLCEQTETSIIILKFSTKAYKAPIWDKLNAIKVKPDICSD